MMVAPSIDRDKEISIRDTSTGVEALKPICKKQAIAENKPLAQVEVSTACEKTSRTSQEQINQIRKKERKDV